MSEKIKHMPDKRNDNENLKEDVLGWLNENISQKLNELVSEETVGYTGLRDEDELPEMLYGERINVEQHSIEKENGNWLLVEKYRDSQNSEGWIVTDYKKFPEEDTFEKITLRFNKDDFSIRASKNRLSNKRLIEKNIIASDFDFRGLRLPGVIKKAGHESPELLTVEDFDKIKEVVGMMVGGVEQQE